MMTADLWSFNEAARLACQGVDLSGFEVVARDGPLGTVHEVTNQVRTTRLVVDTGSRHLTLPAGVVERVDPAGRTVHVDRTLDQVRDAPEFDHDEEATASFQDALSGYYHGLYDTGL